MLVSVSASAFTSESLQVPTHFESHWQVATSSLFTPATIVQDTWFTDEFLEEFEFTFEGVATLFIRVRFRDSDGEPGEWSETLEVFTMSISQRRTLEEAWAFTLDGHVFYVLNLTLEPAIIYDLTAQQWYRWYRDFSYDPEIEPYWNMFRGTVWKGRVLGADIETAQIWEMDPHSLLDEDSIPIKRTVTGFQPIRGSASVRQGAMRIIARREDAAEAATLSMRYSNDNGKTWTAPRTVELAPNSYSQRLEFRSLGRLRAPGRVWEITDTGGFVRIEGADADLEGAQ